jgi:hypothetical protein
MRKLLPVVITCCLFFDVLAQADKVQADDRGREAKTGRYGLNFNGRDSYISVPNIPFDTFKSFTIEAWIKQWHGRVVYQGKEGDPENSIWMSLGAERLTCGWESNQGQNYTYILRNRVLPQWDHVAMVFDGRQQLFFLNGKLVHKVTVPKPGPLDAKRRFLIGAQEKWDASQKRETLRNGRGILGSLHISRVARYSKDFTPKKSWKADGDTVALYQLSERNEKQLLDKSKNKRHGTIHRAKWVLHEIETQP